MKTNLCGCHCSFWLFGVHEMILFFRRNELLLVCRLSSGERTGNGFGHYCSVMMQWPDLQVEQSRLLVWTFLLRTDGIVVIDLDFAYN
jgi:hypothetical protein